MKRIYILGSLNYDLTISAPRIPAAGETLHGENFTAGGGGKGANQAYAAAALGGEVFFAGAAGEDVFGDAVLESLSRSGADTRFVRRSKRHTGVAFITLCGGDNRILVDEGSNGDVTFSDADRLFSEAWAGDLFAAQLEVPVPVVAYAMKKAKSLGMYTVLNPAPARLTEKEAKDLLPYCDLVVPNERELRSLAGKEGDEGAETVLGMGAKAVLVTLGGEGSRLYAEGRKEKIDAVNMGETVDTTAAGDTFCGALLVRLSEGADLAEAAHFASICAGIAVTRRGAQSSVPFRKELPF